MRRINDFMSLRKLNFALNMVLFVISTYIVLLPFLPNFGFWWKQRTNQRPPLVSANIEAVNKDNETRPEQNTLVIPRLLMQETIYEGQGASTLSKGVWRRPQTSDPAKGSNTVLVGHRFTYSDPAVFYHLDKIKLNDEIVVYWQQTKHIYKVSKVFVVPATAVEIESESEEPMLTLYTCTPLWSAKDRLVIQAKLEESI